MVENTSWCRLCAQMMTLLHVLGVTDKSSARLQLRPWPNRELLEAAAAAGLGVFGLFARADASMPSMRALVSHAPPAPSARNRPAAAAAAAAPGGRAGKRRREGAEPPGPPRQRATATDDARAADAAGGLSMPARPWPSRPADPNA